MRRYLPWLLLALALPAMASPDEQVHAESPSDQELLEAMDRLRETQRRAADALDAAIEDSGHLDE